MSETCRSGTGRWTSGPSPWASHCSSRIGSWGLPPAASRWRNDRQVPVLRQVDLEALLELRERVLTPGHPGRPVIWPYDQLGTHYGMFVNDQLIGCVSITPQEIPSAIQAVAA